MMQLLPEHLKQTAIVVSSHLAALSVGGAVTYPTLLMEQFRTNNTSIQLDIDTKSWIGSIHGLAGIPAILIPILTQMIGRKLGYIITCLCLTLGWILSYSATTATEIFISESFHGLGAKSFLPICYMGMTEMLAPKYRHNSMQTYGIAQGIGMAVCGILGRYLHYKTVVLTMLVPIVAAIGIALMWPESPSWFACKGEFDKCERAFIKLRGTDDVSMKELRELITAQRQNLSRTKEKTAIRLQTYFRNILRRDFYLPSVHIFVMFLMMYWSGIDVIYIYFIEIATKSSNSDDAAFYSSIIMYLIVLGGMIITNPLVRKFKNKTLLTYSSCGVVICLLSSSLISGLQTLGTVSENSLLLVYSLIAYTACSNLGFHGLVFMVSAELMPVKHRSLGGALYIIINCLLNASSLKLSPYIIQYAGLWCTFLVYTLNTSICLWFIWKHLPETKGRNLQEIEDYYMFGNFIQWRVDSNSESGENLLDSSVKSQIHLK